MSVEYLGVKEVNGSLMVVEEMKSASGLAVFRFAGRGDLHHGADPVRRGAGRRGALRHDRGESQLLTLFIPSAAAIA